MAKPLSAAQLARNHLGAAIKRGDPPEVIAEYRRKVAELKARAALAAAEADLDKAAAEAAAAMPDVTPAQRDAVALILDPAGAGNGAGS